MWWAAMNQTTRLATGESIVQAVPPGPGGTAKPPLAARGARPSHRDHGAPPSRSRPLKRNGIMDTSNCGVTGVGRPYCSST